MLQTAAVRALADGFVPVAGDEGVSVGELAGADLVPAGPVEAPPELVASVAQRPRPRAGGGAGVAARARARRSGSLLRVPLDPAGLATVAQRIGARLAAAGLPDCDRLALAALDPATASAVTVRGLRLVP